MRITRVEVDGCWPKRAPQNNRAIATVEARIKAAEDYMREP
jgi:hypothetical protein